MLQTEFNQLSYPKMIQNGKGTVRGESEFQNMRD